MEKKLNFTERIIAFLNGDDRETIASKIKTKSLSYIKAALGNCDVMLIKADGQVESAEENLEKALMNNGSTEFSDEYINSLVKANNALLEAEERRRSIEETKKFLEEQKEIINN